MDVEINEEFKKEVEKKRQRMLFDVGSEIYIQRHQTFSDIVIHAAEFDRR